MLCVSVYVHVAWCVCVCVPDRKGSRVTDWVSVKHFHYHIDVTVVWKNSSAITFNSQNTFGMFSTCECLSFSALPLPYHRIPIRKTEILHDLILWPLCVQFIWRIQTQFFSVMLLSSLLPGLEKQITGSDRAYRISCCHTHQQWNAFFVKTATDWNRIDNTTVHATSVQHFKALVVATQHQQ